MRIETSKLQQFISGTVNQTRFGEQINEHASSDKDSTVNCQIHSRDEIEIQDTIEKQWICLAKF